MRFFSILVLFLCCFSACQDELEQLIVAEYPNGKPLRVEHVKYVGDSRITLKETRYYPNGERETECELTGGKENGLKEYFKKDGFKWMEEHYKMGVLDGDFTVWYRSGEINYQGAYAGGKPDGEWSFFDVKGNKTKAVTYSVGSKISEESF